MDYHGKISVRKGQDYSEIYFLIPNNYLYILDSVFLHFVVFMEAYFH